MSACVSVPNLPSVNRDLGNDVLHLDKETASNAYKNPETV